MMKLICSVLVLALFAARDAESRRVFGYKAYRLLGDSSSDTCGRNGLTITATGTTTSEGPEGLTAWEFHGKPDSYVKVTNNGALNFGGKSWTVGTFFNQQGPTRDGPLLEWRGHGPSGNFSSHGTHFWIWGKTLFTNLDAHTGKNVTYQWKAPTANAWHFVGASFDANTGEFYMWIDKEVFHKSPGKLNALDQIGDLYIGIRPADPKYNPLKAKLAGMTLLEGAIKPAQIADFREKIL